MSQLDKLTFIPHFFWFLVIFLFFYFLIFSVLLPIVYEVLKTSELFFSLLFKDVFMYKIFLKFVDFSFVSNFSSLVVKMFVEFFFDFLNLKYIKYFSYLPLTKFVVKYI